MFNIVVYIKLTYCLSQICLWLYVFQFYFHHWFNSKWSFLRQFDSVWSDRHRTMFPVKLFPLSSFAFIYLSTHPALHIAHSPSVTLSDSNLSALQLVYGAVSVFAWRWTSLEMLWLVFFKLWEKATSGPRATVSAVIQNSGIVMPLSPLARAHLPAVRLSAVRETVSAFYHTLPLYYRIYRVQGECCSGLWEFEMF